MYNKDPYAMPQTEATPTAAETNRVETPAPLPKEYRPWSHGRVHIAFNMGVTAAGCMLFFFHPLFSLMAIGFGIPAVVLSAKEIREFPEASVAKPIRWARGTGLFGLIGGSVAFVAFWIIIAVAVSR